MANKADQLSYLFCCVERYTGSHPELAIQLCRHANELAAGVQHKSALARSHYLEAWLRYYESDDPILDVAKAHAAISVELYGQLNDAYGMAASQGLLAAIHSVYGETIQAGTLTEQAAAAIGTLTGRYKDSLLVSAYVNTLRASLPGASPENVRAELKAALEKYRLLNDRAGIARACKNLALVSWAGGEPEPVVTAYFRQALEQYREFGSRRGVTATLVRWGAYYTALFEQDNSRLDYFDQAVACLNQALETSADFEVFAQLGVTYHHKAAAEQAGNSGVSSAIDSMRHYYTRAIQAAEQAESQEQLDVLVRNIAGICGQTGDCSAWMLKVSEVSRAIDGQRRKQAQQAQAQLAQFAEEQFRLRQRNQWITAALLILGLVAVFIFIFFQLRVRSLNRELQAQLKTLQARLNPHFIANCMNAIDALIGDNRLKEASGYIVKFTRLCRNLLDQSDETTVTIAKEVETLKYYFDLEKLRLGDKFEYDISVDTAIRPERTAIPLMLIQPFAENAIWHGIQPKNTPGKVRVSIQALPDDRIKIQIEDNGIGRKKSREIQSRSNREHRSWGMDISRQRIEAIRRMKDASFDITDLENEQGEARGTLVSILLPLKAIRHG